MKKYKNKILSLAILVSLWSFPIKIFAQWDSDVTGLNLPDASVEDIIKNIMNWFLIIIGMVSVIGFIISGIMYLTAAGDEDQIGKAKNAMLYSIIGVIVGLSGLVVLKAVALMLGGQMF